MTPTRPFEEVATADQRIRRVRSYLKARHKAHSGQPPEHIAGILPAGKPERKLLASDLEFLLATVLANEAIIASQWRQIDGLNSDLANFSKQISDLKTQREDARQEAQNERTLRIQAREESARKDKTIQSFEEQNEWICNQLDEALTDDGSTMQGKIKRLCSMWKEHAKQDQLLQDRTKELDRMKGIIRQKYLQHAPHATIEPELMLQNILLEWSAFRASGRPPAQRPSNGVSAINQARTYQLTHHPDPMPTAQNSETRASRQKELLLAALSLLVDNPHLYPFGSDSYRGVCRTHRNRLAHAGACIAALLDLMPAPRREYWNGQPMPADAEDQ